ncbi:hypothetical protein R0G64_32440, partial [Pseudomonas otitidis]|nr:hypothetical protein [Pseudomonas otitidis]
MLRALGTRFLVRQRPDRIQLAVYAGAVRLGTLGLGHAVGVELALPALLQDPGTAFSGADF